MLEFLDRVAGCEPDVAVRLPVYEEVGKFEEPYLDKMFRARVLAYSFNTWRSHGQGVKRYLYFCQNRNIVPYPVNVGVLNLCLLSLAESDTTRGVIESTVAAVSFFSKFLGCDDVARHYNVQQLLKFTSKVCIQNKNPKSGLQASDIRVLWDELEKIGMENLSLVQIRTFVMAVFLHATFCRFSDAASLKLEDLVYTENYFEVKIGFSKANQSGTPQYCIVPNNCSHRNPHKLMCLYLQTMFTDQNDAVVDHVFLFPPLK